MGRRLYCGCESRRGVSWITQHTSTWENNMVTVLLLKKIKVHQKRVAYDGPVYGPTLRRGSGYTPSSNWHSFHQVLHRRGVELNNVGMSHTWGTCKKDWEIPKGTRMASLETPNAPFGTCQLRIPVVLLSSSTERSRSMRNSHSLRHASWDLGVLTAVSHVTAAFWMI